MEAPRMIHRPSVPAWDCRVCGEPWLCDAGRAELVAAYDGQLQAPELRNFLNFAYMSAIRNFQAYGVPRPAEVALRLYGWLASAILAEMPHPNVRLVNERRHWRINKACHQNGRRL